MYDWKKMKKFKILIPIYNDWESVFKLLEAIDSKISIFDHEFSVILVDDASTQKIETGKITGKGTDSDFEDWVKEELETIGYEVTPQVGVSGFFIDLGIKHKDYPFGYLAGVECDGATYHSSLSARDNDITRQKVLENYGWNIYRIWSTNWFNDSKTELRKLDSYLKSIIKNKIN